MTRQTLQQLVGIFGLIVLILAFFVLLSNTFLGWTLVTIGVLLVAASLYTNCLPRLKP